MFTMIWNPVNIYDEKNEVNTENADAKESRKGVWNAKNIYD